jgi:Domain of unknown function (DUF4265)
MTEDGTRVKVRLRAADGGSETLWAIAEGEDRYRLDNIPYVAFGLSWNDIVLAPQVDGLPTFSRIVAQSGHSTYRLALRDDVPADEFPDLVAGLKDLGCTFERFSPRMMGVDVPPSVDIYAVYELIERGMSDRHWEFDEVNVEHPLT